MVEVVCFSFEDGDAPGPLLHFIDDFWLHELCGVANFKRLIVSQHEGLLDSKYFRPVLSIGANAGTLRQHLAAYMEG